MVYVLLNGIGFGAPPWRLRADCRNEKGKLFAGKSSCGPHLLSYSIAAEVKKAPTTNKKKHYSIPLVTHTTGMEMLSMPRNKGKMSLNNQVQTDASLKFLKLLLLCGVFTLPQPNKRLQLVMLPVACKPSPFYKILATLAQAFLLIFFSELGDKTFFIAALLAARNSAAVTFMGTFGALAVMTIISVALGRTFHYVDGLLPFRLGDSDLPIDDLAAVCLLVYFGISSLIEASSSDSQKAEEEQKEAEIAVSEVSGSGAGILAAANTLASTFLLVFVAEWGDKSFFSTIALAAASSPLGVVSGALAGHGVATLLAVVGGSFLGTFLSEKSIAYIGGSLFLLFAAMTLIEIVK